MGRVGIRDADRRRLQELQSQLPRYLDRLVPRDCGSLLDVGCGRTTPLVEVLKRIPRSVGIDTIPAEVDGQGHPVSGHGSYIQGDARDLKSLFPAHAFDIVAGLDVIEHFPKGEGLTLLDTMETIARRRVIVFTPNGFLPQAAFDGNPDQIHLSGWSAAELRERGYRLVGIHGWSRLRGERATITWRPRWLWGRASLYTQWIFESRPEHAFQLLAYRDIDPARGGGSAAP